MSLFLYPIEKNCILEKTYDRFRWRKRVCSLSAGLLCYTIEGTDNRMILRKGWKLYEQN